jgi:hypothetical protein
MPGGGRGIGIGTIILALGAAWLLGVNPLAMLAMLTGEGGPVAVESPSPQPPRVPGAQPAPGAAQAPSDAAAKFVSVVLASTEDAWGQVFREGGAQYQPPKLVLFRGATGTACGMGSAAAGPFYCPADQNVYIDLGFFDMLRDRFRAPGDFAQAYVIAHEVGHHVQNQLGITEKMAAARQRLPEREYNALSVRLELQADCLAGVWASRSDQAKGWLDKTDVDEALRAAAAIGDDNIQRRTQGMVVPESFTHGTSEQRARWFKTGLQSGRIQSCDTFAARAP